MISDFLPFQVGHRLNRGVFFYDNHRFVEVDQLLCRFAGFVFYAIALSLKDHLGGSFFFGQDVSGWRQEAYIHLLGCHRFDDDVIVGGYTDFNRDADLVGQQFFEWFSFSFQRIRVLRRNELDGQLLGHIAGILRRRIGLGGIALRRVLLAGIGRGLASGIRGGLIGSAAADHGDGQEQGHKQFRKLFQTG
ncbi:hypothetical protein D1872_247490 [compost metagenome]